MQGARLGRAVTRQVCRPSVSTKRNSPEVQEAVAAALEARGFPPETVQKISYRQCSIEQVNATLDALQTKGGLSEKDIHKLAARTTTLFKIDVPKRLDILSKCIHDNNVSIDVFRRLLTTMNSFPLSEASFTMFSNNIQLLIPFYKRLNLPETRWFQGWVSKNSFDLEASHKYLVGLAGEEGARKIIQGYPRIITMDVETRVKPMMEKFRSFGWTDEQLVKVLSIFPKVIEYTQSKRFLSKQAFLEELGFDHYDLVKALVKYPGLSSCSEKENRRKVGFLIDYCGFQKCNIVKIIKKCPGLLGFSIEKQLKPKVDYFASLGITGAELESFFKFHGSILFKNMETLEARINRYEKLNFTRDQYLHLVKGNPSILNYSDELLEEKLLFFRSFGKVPLEEVAKYPAFFTFGMDTRVKPRFRFMAWLHLNGHIRKRHKLGGILGRTEPVFKKNFVTPFKEEAAVAYASCHSVQV